MPTGVIVGRLSGVDVRAQGSGNIGATNVARTVGRYAGVLTLIGDLGKGALPLLVARAMSASPTVMAIAGLAAFVGHLFPLFSGFRGGKGVATAAGVFAALSPVALIVSIIAFAVVVGATRIVSLASLVAVTILPLTLALMGVRDAVLGVALVIAVLVWIAHRENVQRLLEGSEQTFRSKR